jgi:ABC-type transport system substrate-binding protein
MRMRLLRRSLLVALAAAIVTTTGGCQSEPEGVVGVVVIDGDPRLATPGTRALTSSEAVLIDNVAQGLVSFDARGQIEPGLAETWNVSDDGLSYIFRLANGDWPDGRKITAEQVARMLRKMTDYVFLDLVMPDIHGMEVLRLLKTNEDTREIPVAIFTSQRLDERQMQDLSAASALVMKKDLSRETVANALQRLRGVDRGSNHAR